MPAYQYQQLFNILPARIRNMTGCSVDCFKRKLDGYLNTVPDEPQIPGYTAQRRAETNSLIDMARFSPAHNQLNVEVPGDSLTPDSRGCATSIAVAHWCQKTQQGNKVRYLTHTFVKLKIAPTEKFTTQL